jgi:hypothetical protein
MNDVLHELQAHLEHAAKTETGPKQVYLMQLPIDWSPEMNLKYMWPHFKDQEIAVHIASS